MRRGLGLSLVFLTAAALAAAPVTAAEFVPMSLRFRPGQILRYNLEQSLLISFQLPGQTTTELRSEVRAVVRRQVLFVTADGTAELLCRMEILAAAELGRPDRGLGRIRRSGRRS